jgi:putative transposase
VKLTAKVKLLTTPEQHAALLATLERANETCNYISDVAWETQTWRQFSLHKLVYYEVRERFSLTAQMAVRCEGKVADAYKLDRKTKRTFRPHGAIAYDDRILKWKLDKFSVSIWTLQGRQEMLFSTGARQLEWLKFQKGESDLVYSGGEFYLLATCEVPEPTPEDVEGYLGVDMGVVELATDSQGTSYSGEMVKRVRRKHRRLRKSLQKKGTKSAKRKLKKLSGRERRFATDTNHCVAKAIVKTAEHNRLGIAVEKLTGIRGRVRVKKAARDDLHSWAFHQLGGFLRYKAQLAGLPLVEVDPRNTSRTPSACGHCDKANRKTQAEFVCRACGYAANADYNAAVNIAARADIKRPTVSGDGRVMGHVCSQVQAPSL